MRRGLPINPTGPTNAALSPRERDRAVLDAFKGLVGYGLDDASGSGVLAGRSDELSGLGESEFVTAWRRLPAVAAPRVVAFSCRLRRMDAVTPSVFHTNSPRGLPEWRL